MPEQDQRWWYCRTLADDRRPVEHRTVLSGSYPEGTVVLTDDIGHERLVDESDVASRVRWDDAGKVACVEATARVAPNAPPLWFVELEETETDPPRSTLVAFTGHDVAPGTLLDREGGTQAPVASTDQVAAIRWTPATGEIDQIYVDPQWRRRSVGTAMIAVVEALNTGRGLSPVWGDGQRTAEGDRWRTAGIWQHRSAELTHLAPPMTPFEDRIPSTVPRPRG